MKRDLLALALLFLAIAFFGREIWLENRSPHRGDIAVQFHPWKSYVKDSLAAGELPYWNPYTHGGAPLLANMQSGVFYPLDLILFAFPIERFYGLSLLLHLALGGAGAYVLARKCGATPFPSLLAGLAYGLNGFTMIHLPAGNHLTYAGAAWAPWMLWAAAGFVQTHTRKLQWGLTGSAVALLHFLCGHPQMAFYSLFFAVLFAFFYSLWLRTRIERAHWLRPLAKTAAWGLFLLLGIGMAGMQLIPTLEYAGEANRLAKLDADAATEFSFAPHRLPALLFPEFFGTKLGANHNHYDPFYYWSNAYAGFIVPLLALYAFLRRPRANVCVPLCAIALAGLFLAWGRGNPFYTQIWMQLPGFGHFRAPAKYLPYYLTAVCALAALGLERLCADAYARTKDAAAPRTLAALALWIAALLVVFGVGWGVIGQAIEAARRLDGLNQAGTIRLFAIAAGLGLGLCGLALWLTARNVPKFPRLAISLSLCALLGMDLYLFGRGYLLDANLLRPGDIQRISAPPAEIGYLRSQEPNEPFRVMTLRDVDIANLFILWDTPNIAGYDPMSLRSYNALLARSEGWEPGAYFDNILLNNPGHPALDALNVRYVFTQQTLGGPALKLLFNGPEFNLYQRTGGGADWAFLADRDETAAYAEPEEWRPAGGAAAVSEYAPHRIAFTVETDAPAWLRVSEWNYPGWRAELINPAGARRPGEMTGSADGFRVVPLPAGEWTVEMAYRPPMAGWALSLAALALFAFLAWADFATRTQFIYKVFQRIAGRYY